MIVADTSALITLASIDIFDLVLEEFDIHTSVTAVEELEDTAEYDDSHGKAADRVLQHQDRFTAHDTSRTEFQSSRIDGGEGSCADLARDLDADFLITDDLRALVKRDVLDEQEAVAKLEAAAENRDWLESPIYTKARDLF